MANYTKEQALALFAETDVMQIKKVNSIIQGKKLAHKLEVIEADSDEALVTLINSKLELSFKDKVMNAVRDCKKYGISEDAVLNALNELVADKKKEKQEKLVNKFVANLGMSKEEIIALLNK